MIEKGTTCADHFPDQPEPGFGMIEWDDWAQKMSKTHRQSQCAECHRWEIWTPRIRHG